MLSKFSVKKPFTIVVAVIIVLILGSISFVNLKTDLLPSIDLPFVVVTTTYPGASPEEVEMVVTRPIEQILATTSNIENVSSISRENSSSVMLEFNNDVNMDSAIIEISGSLDLIKPSWGSDVGSPMIMRLNPDMLPVMLTTVDVEGMDLVEITKLVSDDIIPEFESINGVASVDAAGFIKENLEVYISPDKIESLNKKILKSIDSELSKVEDELLGAKAEINNGKSQLESEKGKQSTKLAEGEKALNAGKDQILSAQSQMEAGEAELIKNKKELEKNINMINEKQKELKNAKKQLENLGEDIPEQEKIALKEINKNLEVLLRQKAQADVGLKTISSKLGELKKEKIKLEAKKKELNQQEKQIKEGKAVLNTKMNKAKAELESGEAKLNDGISELEASKEEAFKKASLDGVITDEMISGILAAQNFSMPAGYITEDQVDYLVKVGEKIKDKDELDNLFLFDTGIEEVGKIHLKDVADIEMKNNSKDIYTKVNGNDAVALMFQKQSNYSTAEVSNNIRDKIEEITGENENISITSLMDQGVYIDVIIESVLKNLVYGGLLAILILLLFLRDINPTIIIALSIPISIIFAIAMMYFTGITINIISLAGLALGVGMLVDNSIVAIENIYRLKNEGMSAREASIEGAKEVSGALFASTLTTAIVFLPIIFTKGISRQLFTDMGLTIAYSLFASLIVALTLVPMMASKLLKKTKKKSHSIFDKFTAQYERILNWSLNHKGIVLTTVVALLVISIILGASMGTAFIPEMEGTQMALKIELPKESTIQDTRTVTDSVFERIIDVEGIETLGALQAETIGGLGGDSKDNIMSMYVILKEESVSNISKIENEILEKTKDLDAKISIDRSTMDISAMAGSGIEVIVKGRDLEELRNISRDIANILEETKGTIDISDGLDESEVEMKIIVDKEKAMEKGLTVAQVYSEINTIISKQNSATTLTFNNKDYPVLVVDGKTENIDRKDLEDIIIEIKENGEKTQAKLSDIANVIETDGLSQIKRDSQERYLSVTAGIDKDYNIGLVSRDFEEKLENYKVKDGYRIELSGENEMINESLKDLLFMLILAIAFIYLIMVSQFQSLLSPFIVMFTIPLAFTGGLLALAITGYDLSMIAMLGFLVLSGVVVNNGIVFVDYTNQLRDSDISIRESLIQAGKTRIRPILMTAITTILGLSTLSVGVGMGAEAIQPLAIVAIGGLIYSTILTLLVVPVMYEIFHKDNINKGDE